MQSILWMQTNVNKNKYKTNIMEVQIDFMAKVYFWFDSCQQGQYNSNQLSSYNFTKKNIMHAPGSSFKWHKMIKAQFINS